jgi:O-antigen ligase
VLLGVALLVTRVTAVMSRRLLVVVVALAAAGVVSTVSFTPIAGMVAGTLFLLPLARRPQRWFAAVAVGGAVLAILFGPLIASRYHEQFATYGPVKQRPYLPQNLNFRIDVWTTEFVPVLKSRLTTGYGPDEPPNLVFKYTESVYVTLLLRGGLPLLVIYGALMAALALRARDVKDRDPPEARAVAHVAFLLVVLAFFMQTVTNYFVNSGFPFLFWVLAALLFTSSGVGSTRQLRRSADEPGKTSQAR